MRYSYDSRTTVTRSSSVPLVPPRDHSTPRRQSDKPVSTKQQAPAQSSTLHQQFSKLTPIYSLEPKQHTKIPARLVHKNLEFTKHTHQPKRHHGTKHTAKSPVINTLEFAEANLDSIDLDSTDGVIDVVVLESLLVGGSTVTSHADPLQHYFKAEDSEHQQILNRETPSKKTRLKYVGRFLVLALLASVVGLWGYLLSDSFFITNQANATTQQTNAEGVLGVVADSTDYNPKTLTIGKLSIHATIDHIGTTPTGAMDVPSSIWNAGWYTGSAKPGQPGAVFIDGHASSNRGALFGNLDTLAIGDRIEIERNDGVTTTYSVAKISVVNRNDVDMSEVLKPYDSQKNGLTIMSCVGQWIADEKTMENRVLVYAAQI